MTQTAHDPRERRKSVTEADQLPWDWQTGALVLAVCACIVFFLVAGCSALVYARQWRRMKKNFEPGKLGKNGQGNTHNNIQIYESLSKSWIMRIAVGKF